MWSEQAEGEPYLLDFFELLVVVFKLLVQVGDSLCGFLVLFLKDLLDAGGLLLVGIVRQLQVLCHILVSRLLLHADLLGDLKNLLLQVLDGGTGSLGVWSVRDVPTDVSI